MTGAGVAGSDTIARVDGDEQSQTTDLRRERRVVAASVVVVVALVGLGYVLSHRTDAASPLSALPTAYARITDSRLAVEYEVTDSQPVVEVSADETSTTVTLRVLVTPFDPSAGQGIAPLSPVTSTVDLASPRGDRRVVDSTGSPLPEESREDLGA